MSTTWQSPDQPEHVSIGLFGWILVALRGLLLFIVILTGLVLMLLLRLIERPIWSPRRPITPHITRVVCRVSLMILGLGYQSRGKVMRHAGAIVANHATWLDVFVLNAGACVYFVSKAEVARWPGIGVLARATGTMFINRTSKEAAIQTEEFRERLSIGQRILFFPEGTSTDGQRLLPFKSTLFESFFVPSLQGRTWVQPVTVRYHAPRNRDPRFYAWWGDMAFGTHLLQLLAAPRQGKVEVIWHPPLRVADYDGRRSLAMASREVVESALDIDLPANEITR